MKSVRTRPKPSPTPPLEILDATEFRTESGIYVFPFKGLNPSLGRIEWCLEFERRRGANARISSVLVWAMQTKDERYRGKTFRIPCRAERFTSSMLEERRPDEFLSNVWSIHYCREHHRAVYDAYPKDHHTHLIIDASSSISMTARFARTHDG